MYRYLMVILLVLSGCAAETKRNDWSTYTGPGAAYFQKEEYVFPLPNDPLEPTNRMMWGLNNAILLGVVDPLSTGWRYLVPETVRRHLGNACVNLRFPERAVNNLLQGQFKEAGDESVRFLVNTTVGVLGLFDKASEWDIPASRENSSRTLIKWGWEDSTYLTLPLFGPGSTRDTVGLIGDKLLDPATYFFPAGPIIAFIEGSEHMDAYKRYVRTNLDPYESARVLWWVGSRIRDLDFKPSSDCDAAVQTLEAVFLRQHDPWFPYRASSRKVKLESTGEELAYELWMQPEPAPIVFVIPGMGSHRLSKQSIVAAEMVYRRGFSAVTVSSSMNFEFMESAATAAVPGFVPADAHDTHVTLDAIDRDIDQRYPGRNTARVLMGLSLGAVHTLHICTAAQQDPQLIDFDRYVALNPSVQVLYGVEQLDAMYNSVMSLEPRERDGVVIEAIQKALRAGMLDNRTPSETISFSRTEAEFLIGLSYRIVLHDVIWYSQNRTHMGVLKTPLDPLERTPASREILDFSYMEYFYAFVLPYFTAGEGTQTVEETFARCDLRSIAQTLPADGTVQVFSNRNDFLLTPEDITWLTEQLGEDNVHINPGGGHLGTLGDEKVHADIMETLHELLMRSP